MQQIREILLKYNGKMKEEPGRITFTNTNEITDWQGKKHKVPCEIAIRMSFIVDPNRYSVSMEEKTLAILGGSSCGHLTREEAMKEVRKGLKKYCFTRNAGEQLSLF